MKDHLEHPRSPAEAQPARSLSPKQVASGPTSAGQDPTRDPPTPIRRLKRSDISETDAIAHSILASEGVPQIDEGETEEPALNPRQWSIMMMALREGCSVPHLRRLSEGGTRIFTDDEIFDGIAECSEYLKSTYNGSLEMHRIIVVSCVRGTLELIKKEYPDTVEGLSKNEDVCTAINILSTALVILDTQHPERLKDVKTISMLPDPEEAKHADLLDRYKDIQDYNGTQLLPNEYFNEQTCEVLENMSTKSREGKLGGILHNTFALVEEQVDIVSDMNPSMDTLEGISGANAHNKLYHDLVEVYNLMERYDKSSEEY